MERGRNNKHSKESYSIVLIFLSRTKINRVYNPFYFLYINIPRESHFHTTNRILGEILKRTSYFTRFNVMQINDLLIIDCAMPAPRNVSSILSNAFFLYNIFLSHEM